MTLEKYKRSITGMTDEELLVHLADVRKRRRTPAKPEARRKASGERKQKSNADKLKDALKGMNPDDLAALKAILKGKN